MKLIFTHLKPDIWQYKVAKTLRKQKIETVSVSLLECNRKMFDKAFNKIISLNLPNLKPKTILRKALTSPSGFIRFFYYLLTIKADAAICQGAPHYLTALFIRLFKGKFPRIYFPYDMNFSRYKNPEKFFPKREIWGERYSFRNCDGIITKSLKEEISSLPENFKAKSKPVLAFHCYALDEWNQKFSRQVKLSSKDKEIHIVYCGSYNQPEDVLATPTKEVAKKIISQMIHFHIYPTSQNIDKKDFDYMDPEKKFRKYIHVQDYVHPEKLSEELSRYDFGLHYAMGDSNIKPQAWNYAAANKFASYLEAGIPPIVNREATIYTKPMTEQRFGIVIDNLLEIKKRTANKGYKKMIKNLCDYRKKYSVEKHIDEIIGFIGLLKKQ